MREKRPLNPTSITAALLAFAVLVMSFSPLGAGTARAIPVEDIPAFGQRTYDAALQTSNRVESTLWRTLGSVGTVALMNAANYFAQRIAYDAANYIAAGATGEKPFFETQGLGDYFKNTALDAAGEAIATVSQGAGWEELGINLCSPSTPEVSLNVTLGLMRDLPFELGVPLGPSQPQPRCEWKNIQSSWEQFASQSTDEVLGQVGSMFNQGESELSAALNFNTYARQQIAQKLQEAQTSYETNQGFRDLRSRAGEYTLTPASVIKDEQQAIRDEQRRDELGDALIAANVESGGLQAILGSAFQTFVSTLGEKMMKKVFEKGLVLLSQAEVEERDLYGTALGSPLTGGRAAAELANASLLTPRILTTTNYDELAEFATCPPDTRGPSNCVIDTQFFTAVTRSSQDAPLTLRQAVEQGLIPGDWKLLPATHAQNRDKNCYLSAFCYSNLVKLRRARILPVGWELAANSRFNDQNRPVSLREAMDNFNNCPVDADGNFDPSGLPDALHPWCHLVDPEWVLKYPKTICRQRAYGPTPLAPQVAARGQTCVDPASCIAEDASGNCVGGYGYCLREKSFWRLDADSCPAEYATCQALVRSDNTRQAFLMNTISQGTCTAENAGCQEYSVSANLVPNAGFEDAISRPTLGARDWSYGSGSTLDGTGRKSLQGTSALGVAAGSPATARISVIPGAQYALSASVLQDNESSGPFQGTVRIEFRDDQDDPIAAADADCDVDASGRPTLELDATSLGYVSATCSTTAPAGAVQGVVTLSSAGSAGNPVWFDQIGLFGTGYSNAPLEKVFLNGRAEACNGRDKGCTQLLPLAGDSFNMIMNPGFETRSIAGNTPRHWTSQAANYVTDRTGVDGLAMVRLSNASGSLVQVVDGVLSGATYAFSVFSGTENASGASPDAFARLTALDASGADLPAGDQPDCDASGASRELALETESDLNRAVCVFTAPDGAAKLRISLFSSGAGSNPVLVDAAQLELGSPTGFHLGHSSGSTVSIKKAPEGLQCTGASTDPAACAGTAPSCRREEVGCDIYTPKDGTVPIPAITAGGDACPASCVGYASFRQEPTNFESEKFPLFFIPSTATACSAAAAGCEEFTNLERLSAGGESREFYSALRACQKDDASTATYYTWEGNDASGFQLRVWTLRQSNLTSPASGDAGADPTGGVGPCTTLRYDANGRAQCADDPSGPEGACTKALMGFNPDCREFYDVDGNIHYRLYSKTVVSTPDCVEYRATRGNETDCAAHGGRWLNNECRYFALPGESRSCSAQAVGCRAYAGNASRNVRIAMSDDFEDGTTGGWFLAANQTASPNVTNSNESVSAGGHSLRGTGARVMTDVSTAIRQDRFYLLSFWAKGNGDVIPHFSQAADDDFPTVSLTTEWRQYTLGPINVTRTPDRGTDPDDREQLILDFVTSASPQFFIDNLYLREVSESLYVIADSWETPAVCDQSPSGAPSPQYMLGCQVYSDSSNREVTLKSFDRLCRPEAAGCKAFYDTKATASPFAETFRAVCTMPDTAADADTDPDACNPAAGAATCPCSVTETGATATVCQVSRGATTCRYDTEGDAGNKLADTAPYDGHIDPSGDTIRVAADRLVFLIDRPQYRCAASAIGCTEVGVPQLDAENRHVESWTTSYLKNLPETYDQTLCAKTEVSCQAYKRAEDGAPLFFKDPGKHLCEFKKNVLIGGRSVDGWFRKGTDTPCYADYLEAGSLYGIWKNSDPLYDAWVGECQPQFSQCKEFIDPRDTSTDHPEGQPYYAIMNDRLDVRTCRNQASLNRAPSGVSDASACVLFSQTDNLTDTYSTARTYEASEARDGALVGAVNDPATNDANIVIRVKRDRRCGEWLDCRSSETVWNAALNQFTNVCTAYGVCKRFVQVGDTARCAEYADTDTGALLTSTTYAKRNIGWEGQDYAGYSVPNQYPVQELVSVNISEAATPDIRLVRTLGRSACNGRAYGDLCGPTNEIGNQGTCLGPTGSLQCVYPIDGSAGIRNELQTRQRYTQAGYPSASCRAYPQEDAPFPSSVADPNGWNLTASDLNSGNPVLIAPNSAFAGANVCQRRLIGGVEVSTCECSYQIAMYGGTGGLKKYFPIEDSDIPAGYCQGGEYEGYECDPSATGLRSRSNPSCCSTLPETEEGFAPDLSRCGDESACRPVAKIDRVVGYQGQCLERDLSMPINNRADEYSCATWRPVGLVGGTRDIYNLYTTAGYFAKPDRQHYCVGQKDRWMLRLGINTTQDIDPRDNFTAEGVTVGPYDQPTNKFFGPGTVSSAVQGFSSGNADCGNAADSLPNGGGWCNYPGLSQKSTIQVGTSSTRTQFGISGDAIGVLGCYEVSDQTKGLDPSITYPYIGPPIYKDQLDGMYFQVVSDLYYFGDGNSSVDDHEYSRQYNTGPMIGVPNTSADDEMIDFGKIPTNPFQQIFRDCNDEAGSSIDSDLDDAAEINAVASQPLNDTDATRPGMQFNQGGDAIYYMDDSNSWTIDPSDGEGMIKIQASFDKSGKLSKLTIVSNTNNSYGEGTFGIRELGFIFKPGCDQIARVDEPGEFGLTKANTDAINDYRDFAGFGPTAASFYDQSCRPWGAIGGITSTPSRSPWTYVTTHGSEQAPACTAASYRTASLYENMNVATPGANDASTLQKIFRKIFGLWSYEELYNENASLAQESNYEAAVVPGTSDLTDDHDNAFTAEYGQPVPPTIATVNDAACDGNQNCPAASTGSLTLNGRNDGVIVAADGVLPITARFFGWASHNAMPIVRRVMLWGDASPTEPPAKGWYKNQKPFCSADTSESGKIGECQGYRGLTCRTAVDCPSGSACQIQGQCSASPFNACSSDIDCQPDAGICLGATKNHFGNTPGACSAAPFQFDHTYLCTANDLAALPVCCGNPASNAPCRRQDAGVWSCVYRPAAQIIDNWGWCNCTGTNCELPNAGEHGADCNPATATSTRKPWTEYAGEIRLTPTASETARFQQMLADGAVTPPPACSILPPITGGFDSFAL